MIHHLKTQIKYFKAVKEEIKLFEIRVADRNYNIGDILHLKEFNENTKEFTGDEICAEVTYILNEQPFVPKGYIAMGIKSPVSINDCTESNY